MQRISEDCDPTVEEVGRALNMSPAAVRQGMSIVLRDGHECVNHVEIERFADQYGLVCACGLLLGFRGRLHACPIGRDRHGGADGRPQGATPG
jgi:hypothetical protein